MSPTVTHLTDPAALFAALTTAITTAHQSARAAHYLLRLPATYAPAAHKALWQAVTLAPRRIPDCRIILNRKFPTPTLATWNTQTAAALAAAGWRVRWHTPRQVLHAKLWCLDAADTTTGSTNITATAAHTPANSDTRILCTAYGAQIANWFDQLWRKATPHATELTT